MTTHLGSGQSRSSRRLMILCGLILAAASGPASADVEVSVEHVVRGADVIALGRITETDPEGTEVGPMKQLFTRSTFKVEAYYKGAGPEEINVFSHGGVETDPNGRMTFTTVSGGTGVRTGEEVLLFLRAVVGEKDGYWIFAHGAKYEVKTDQETGQRTVTLRFRKKKYMRGKTLEGFERLAQFEEMKATVASGELPIGRFLTEKIRVEDLGARLEEVVKGEALPVL